MRRSSRAGCHWCERSLHLALSRWYAGKLVSLCRGAKHCIFFAVNGLRWLLHALQRARRSLPGRTPSSMVRLCDSGPPCACPRAAATDWLRKVEKREEVRAPDRPDPHHPTSVMFVGSLVLDCAAHAAGPYRQQRARSRPGCTPAQQLRDERPFRGECGRIGWRSVFPSFCPALDFSCGAWNVRGTPLNPRNAQTARCSCCTTSRRCFATCEYLRCARSEKKAPCTTFGSAVLRMSAVTAKPPITICIWPDSEPLCALLRPRRKEAPCFSRCRRAGRCCSRLQLKCADNTPYCGCRAGSCLPVADVRSVFFLQRIFVLKLPSPASAAALSGRSPDQNTTHTLTYLRPPAISQPRHRFAGGYPSMFSVYCPPPLRV